MTRNTDNSAPVVAPGLPSSSRSSSFSTSTSQGLLSDPAAEGRDDPASGNCSEANPENPKQSKKKNDNRDPDDRLRDLPEWLEAFTDNLEDSEVQVPAHSSQDSDSERSAKVVSKSRKCGIYTNFPEDRNCDVCLLTKITRAPCSRRTGGALPRADSMTADHKVLNKDCESRHNHRHAVAVQDPATQRIPSHPCKTKTSQETEKSFASCRRSHNSLTLTIGWNSANPVKNCHGIIELQHLIDPRRTVLWADMYGMLLPSSKCPRPPGGWENSIRTTIRRTIYRTNNSHGAMVDYLLPDFCTRPV